MTTVGPTKGTHGPPKGLGPLQKTEARLAWGLLFPTIFSVSLVVILPLLAIFWISFKPVQLQDLRAPTAFINETLRGSPEAAGDSATIRYTVRNSHAERSLTGVTFTDLIPDGLTVGELDPRCRIDDATLFCDLGTFTGGMSERILVPVTVGAAYFDEGQNVRGSDPVSTGQGDNILTNLEFTLDNFVKVFNARDFWQVLYATTFYTVFGTIGALVFGLFAAQLLNKSFHGKGFMRGLFLFPYVAPVIAVALTWVNLFDPSSGSINALLLQMGLTQESINFFGQRPLALIMVTVFEIWRYFPLSFLFILARMQSIDSDMYEAADMDGASPFQKFWYLSLPQLAGILSVLFLLRFIWTFNKFDDIFLLTGGNAGTLTLTVNVYKQAFAISNIGAGAAVAVVIFCVLLLFSFFFFRIISREEGL
ncbi:MAG: sugar ABC transporter permease [Rhodobacteraceae bacterium]|nr:sugar ABC transporter permease [Paracoccaceae bacterium]